MTFKEEVHRTILIEGTKVSVTLDTDTSTKESYFSFCRSSDCVDCFDKKGFLLSDPHLVKVGWDRPISALKKVFSTILEMVETSVPQGYEVQFEGADAQRTRVYRAMLRRAGIKAVTKLDSCGDQVLRIFV